ncbi:Isy1-like splicing family-domain-containing protein [Mariannaea sp. PMI_226]|nr:Isy1-like splicing family-domain-containing protein [Mariannaea sp. PMI_226]
MTRPKRRETFGMTENGDVVSVKYSEGETRGRMVANPGKKTNEDAGPGLKRECGMDKARKEEGDTPLPLSVNQLLTFPKARNSEKAQSMLFRFREAQAADLGIIDAGRTRRPKIITEVTSIAACEKWRGQVLRDISRKMSRIQDPMLSDYQIRDCNDELNKHFREKHMWEVQIRNLGGPNYMRGGKVYDEGGKEIPGGGKGYKYYGRARELPGVKELFEAAKSKGPEEKPLEESKDLRRNVDAAYYGYAPDDEDEELLAYEAEKERQATEHMMQTGSQVAPEGWEPLPGDSGDGQIWELPTLEEVQEELVDRRRRKLLEQL